MIQWVEEAVTYAQSLNSNYEIILAGDYLDVLINDEGDDVVSSSEVGSFDGVLLTGLNYVTTNISATDSVIENESDLTILYNNGYPILAVDYCSACSIAHDDYIMASRLSSTDNFFDNINGNAIDGDTVISTIYDVNNYIIINDDVVTNAISEIAALDYDLIIINPFSSMPNSTIDEMYTKENITSLKVKSDGSTSRLVYAYIDIGYANSNYYYWESDWDIEYPTWIDDDYEYKKYQTKYWRSAWKAYIINIINEANDLDFDGFVFGGLDAHRNY